jgi:hypothetical protein
MLSVILFANIFVAPTLDAAIAAFFLVTLASREIVAAKDGWCVLVNGST